VSRSRRSSTPTLRGTDAGGPNFEAVAEMQRVSPSGCGVRRRHDAADVARLAQIGSRCIIGRSLYEGSLRLAEAIERRKSSRRTEAGRLP